jgi:hypothetical protein
LSAETVENFRQIIEAQPMGILEDLEKSSFIYMNTKKDGLAWKLFEQKSKQNGGNFFCRQHGT